MAGFWDPNITALLSKALLTNGQCNPPPVVNPALDSWRNDLYSARAFLAASLPQPQTTAAPCKTKSTISLPPSLANKRRKQTERNPTGLDKSVGSESNVSNQASTSCQGMVNHSYAKITNSGEMGAANFSLSGSNPQLPTFDLLSSKSDLKAPEETPTPVFSTGISFGKEFPVPKQDQPTQSILLKPSNTRNKLFPHGAHRVLHDNDHWHKFIISGQVSQNKDKILKRILELSDPTLLLPIMYQEEGDTAVFYARNCGSAIERLCRNNQLNFEIDSQKFVLWILLQCAPVSRLKLNPLTVLRKVLEKRYNTSDRCLDLSDFEHDSDLTMTMYCPLSQPSVLHYVLTSAIMSPINFSTLRLCYNKIRILKIEVLMKASYLRTLDLSHNELLYPNDIKGLKELSQVSKLILDGNPLCADFRTPEEYISNLKCLMPQLICLDLVSLFPGKISVPKVKNFLCSKEGHQLVDQFLMHFFNRYDWKDRRCLDGLYHNNAIFSLTCVHLTGQSTSDGCSLTWYTTYNHNLAKMSDYSKVEKNMYHGPDEILELFSSLPASEHDPYSFCVDLMHYNNKAAVVSVAGVFREHLSLPPEPDHMRSFRRVFNLCCTAPNEWQIINEQLHISNLTTEQAEASFKIQRPPVEAPVAAWLVQDAQLLSDSEKEQMACIMMQLTTLNKEWATRFLKESYWYVREALIAFVNKFETNTLPDDAFEKNNSAQLVLK